MVKATKLYEKSPRLKRNESGEVAVEKPGKSAHQEQELGLAGNKLPGTDGAMPIHDEHVEKMHERHRDEMKSMHGRHEAEAGDMHKRHMKEHKDLLAGPAKKVEETK